MPTRAVPVTATRGLAGGGDESIRQRGDDLLDTGQNLLKAQSRRLVVSLTKQ